MRVLLLAAGLGTRLRPITDTIPKCLVPIGGKPLLQIWLERLTEAGFGPFLINTHYLHHQVERFIENSTFKDKVTIVYEHELLGTAGTLYNNIDFFQDEDGMVLHADNYCLADLRSFLEAHENCPKGCEVTMMTFKADDPKSCGVVELDEKGVVVGFHEKVNDPPTDLANGAVYIFSADALDTINSECKTMKDISTEIIPVFIGNIFAYVTQETFVDVGVPERYKKLLDEH